MKFSALSLLALVSTACAQTVTVTSVNQAQATRLDDALSSYSSEIDSEASSITDLLSTATDYTIPTPFPYEDLPGSVFYTFTDPSDWSSLTSYLNAIITSSVEADGALQTFVDFIQSSASAQASIINNVSAAPGLTIGVGVWTMAMVVAGVAFVLM